MCACTYSRLGVMMQQQLMRDPAVRGPWVRPRKDDTAVGCVCSRQSGRIVITEEEPESRVRRH